MSGADLRPRADTAAARALPTSIAVVLVSLYLLIVRLDVVTSVGWLVAGAGTVLVLQVLAMFIPVDRAHDRLVLVIPVLSLLAVGLFRVGTGGSTSMFGAILLLPLLWIAAEQGRYVVPVASASVVVGLLMPYLLGTEEWANGQLLRVLVSGAIFTVLAAVVHGYSHRASVTLRHTQQLAEERAALLDEAERQNTALERTAAELRAAESLADSIWRALDRDAVLLTDLDGGIEAIGLGAGALLGYPVDAFTRTPSGAPPERDIIDLVVGDESADREERLARLVDVGRSEGMGGGDLEFLSEDGERVPVFLSCSVRRDSAGEPVGYIFVARDARYAREIDRLKDEFVGTVSHELRTPLSSILGYLELVADEEETLSDDQRKFLGVAERNAQRLLHLVGDLLFIAQVDGGKMPIEIAQVDLGAVAAASAETVMPVAAGSDVRVRTELPSEPLFVSGDARRLGQAVDNLASNAVKFTPAGGEVVVGVRREGGDAVVTVRDTGIGIPAEELSRLAERFFRARTATREAIQGVGLGLSITKAIVGAHGGTLTPTSVVGEGTTFEIRLPLASSPSVP